MTPDYAALTRYLVATMKQEPGIPPLTEAMVRRTYAMEVWICASPAMVAKRFPLTSPRSAEYLAVLTFICGHPFASDVIGAIPDATPTQRSMLRSQLARDEQYRS